MDETVKKAPSANANYYIRIIGTLFVITAVVSLLLGVVNMLTKPTIEALAAEKKQRAMEQVMPDAQFTPLDALPEGAEGILEIQVAKDGDTVLGYCVQVETSGFGGAMQLMVGVDQNAAVTGVNILSHAETLNTDKHGGLIAQYAGVQGEAAITKDGGTIEAISGATVTSKAVTRGVNRALAAVAAVMEGGNG